MEKVGVDRIANLEKAIDLQSAKVSLMKRDGDEMEKVASEETKLESLERELLRCRDLTEGDRGN